MGTQMQERTKKVLLSKTVWGAVFAALAGLLKVDHIGVLDILRAIGEVLMAIGIRDAIGERLLPRRQ